MLHLYRKKGFSGNFSATIIFSDPHFLNFSYFVNLWFLAYVKTKHGSFEFKVVILYRKIFEHKTTEFKFEFEFTTQGRISIQIWTGAQTLTGAFSGVPYGSRTGLVLRILRVGFENPKGRFWEFRAGLKFGHAISCGSYRNWTACTVRFGQLFCSASLKQF